MGVFYSRIPKANFIWDAKHPETYVDSGNVSNLIDGTTMSMVGVNANASLRTYTFENGNNSFSASDYIRFDPDDNLRFVMRFAGCSGAVTFNNTSLLDANALSYYRQIPFSYGSDSTLGQFNFERPRDQAAMRLRYKFDQDPQYGSTSSFGNVSLNNVHHLAFTVTSDEIVLFLDGVEVNTVDISSKTLNTANVGTTRNLCIGALGNSASPPAYGFIGEIYNATHWQLELTAEQIRDHANRMLARYS